MPIRRTGFSLFRCYPGNSSQKYHMRTLIYCLLLPLLASAQPHIVFMLIDDLGWSDLRIQGNEKLHTPHIDQLAAEGMRFTDAYAAAPVCSPTRAAILTGLSPAKLGLTNHLPDAKRHTPKGAKLLPATCIDHLPPSYITIAERLKDSGYATGFFGKWHLSGPGKGLPENEPTAQGFDVNIGGCSYGGPPTFFDPYRIHNLDDRKEGEYLPDRLADEAVTFLQDNRETPTLVFLWYYTVHWPMEAPEADLAKYRGKEGPGLKDHRYGAMIEAMDRSAGKVLDAIDPENTLVIFTSDNGGFAGVADNRPLRDAKGELYEGGIRVPLIVRWPGKVNAGQTCSTPVISMDFYPTLLQAAGLAPVETEGESLFPLFNQSGTLQRKSIYFHYPNYAWHRGNKLGSAIREGKYKLIERFENRTLELYDLENDLGERLNLANKQPEKAEAMRKRLEEWRKRVGAKMPQPAKP